jgi:DNA-binding NarL/FixJ family response regulator
METLGTNLFIVDDNKLMVQTLKQFLQNRFGISMHISTFSDGESCLLKIDKDTHIVILDYFMTGKNGLDILKAIKNLNPKTEVIMLSSNEDMAVAIESFRAGAKDFVIKGADSWKKITTLINNVITAPIRLMVQELSISKQLAVLLMVFFTIGIVVFCVMEIMQ